MGAPLLLLLVAIGGLISRPARAQIVSAISPLNAIVHMDSSSVTITEELESEFMVAGSGLVSGMQLFVTTSSESCADAQYPHMIEDVVNGTDGIVKLSLPYVKGKWHFCLNGTHQGAQSWLSLNVREAEKPFLPAGVTILIVLVLLCLSGIFSGLNVGLMSFAPQELEIMIDAGDEKQKKYAKRILPLRRKGNFLLCTILFSNVLVNNTTAILLEGLAGGIVAVLGATIAVVLCGEIFPQAVCSRHALLIGAHTTWVMKFFVFLTSPLSYPMSVVLDFFLGEEVGAYYERNQLLEMVRVQQEHTNLANSEVDIITGALTYGSKVTKDIMTPLADVEMLDVNSILDFKTMKKIVEMGHTRIPCFRGDRDEIVGLLTIKDLAFIDPDDETPLETVIKYYNHRLEWVYDDTKLDILLELFKQGKAQMFLVVDIDNSGDGDPVRRTVGVVTLEDVIEEIIQAEIEEESEGMSPRRGKSIGAPRDFGFAAKHHVKLSEHLVAAASTYLSATIKAFAPEKISPTVLKKLVGRFECHRELFLEELKDGDKFLYVRGQPSSVFTLMLEGNVHVEAGSERLVFEAGPFQYFGVGALASADYVSDFTVTAKSERVLLLQISRSLYHEAEQSSSKWRNSASSVLRASTAASSQGGTADGHRDSMA